MADVNNQDINGLYARIHRYMREVYKSTSSGLNSITSADMIRWKAYLGHVSGLHAWAVGEPELDLPETHPKIYTLEEKTVFEIVNNEAVNDFLNMLENTNDALANASSARNAAGLSAPDSKRFTDNITKCNSFLDYVASSTPQDLPETSPDAVSSGAGTTGI